MNKIARKVNPDFFKQQQNDEVQVFVGKRPTTSNGNILSSIKLQQGATRSSIATTKPEETNLTSRAFVNKSKQTLASKTLTRKEPIPPQQESLYEMTRYLNKQTSEDYSLNDDSFQLENNELQLFKPVTRQHTLRVGDLDDSYSRSDTPDQEESDQDQNTPQSIHESPIKKPLPSHRRSLSARMLPNMGRGFVNPRTEESEEESPVKQQFRDDLNQKRKPPRYPSSLLQNSNFEEPIYNSSTKAHGNIEFKKLQEEINRLTGETNMLKREKTEQTKSHNEKIRSLQERHTEEIQNQQKRSEKLLEDKDNRILELQRENERLREQLGVSDKSKDGQDTIKLLNELEIKRKTVSQFETDKIVLMDQIEKLKYDISEYSRQLKEYDIKVRHKEETIHGLSNKIETQEKEIKLLKEKEYKEINEREKALSMFTESDKANQQLQDKLKNLEFQSKQIQRDSEILSQRCNSLETTKVQLEKTNDQLRSKLQIMDVELNNLSQEQAMLLQDREQSQLNKHRTHQELENCRRELSNLRDGILKNDKPPQQNSFLQSNTLEHSNYIPDTNPSNFNYYQTNSNYNRKNTNMNLSSYSAQGLLGNDSYSGTSPNLISNSKEHGAYQYRENQIIHSQPNQNTRYQSELFKESQTTETPLHATPKQSATTAKVMSIINRESPKERQHNRNKIMGTSYSITPFALDDSSNMQTSNIDEQLMQLSLEKTKLEGDMQKLFSMGIKSIAAKKQKMSLELRLEEIDKQSSQLKMRLRNMNY